MSRTTTATATHKRRKRLLEQAKGNRGARRSHIRKAKETVLRAMAYSTRDRQVRKREFRSLWIIRLSAAARARGLTYSKMMASFKKSAIALDRKQLAELAINDAQAFDELVSQAAAH